MAKFILFLYPCGDYACDDDDDFPCFTYLHHCLSACDDDGYDACDDFCFDYCGALLLNLKNPLPFNDGDGHWRIDDVCDCCYPWMSFSGQGGCFDVSLAFSLMNDDDRGECYAFA